MAVGYPDRDDPVDDLVSIVLAQVRATMQNASIGSAGLRVYGGGWIRIENGGLAVTGTASVTGLLTVDGRLLGTGEMVWSGPWELAGPGLITGNVNGSGNLAWSGEWELEGDGTISGDVKITGDTEILGKLDVTGDTRLRGKTTLENDLTVTNDGKIKVGQMTITPTRAGGAVEFANGTFVAASGNGVAVTTGVSNLLVDPGSIKAQVGLNVLDINGTGIRVTPGAIPSTTDTDSLNWLGIDKTTGYLKRVDPAVGGPGGGPFEWPFPLSSVTSEFGPRPEMGDYHTGMDFGQPSGTPIPAPAAGTVVASGWVDNFGGYHIKIDHGMRGGKKLETGYFHLVEAPALQPGAMVAKGTIVGHVGSTGASTGPHLHWETFIDGVQVNPRSFMDAYGKK